MREVPAGSPFGSASGIVVETLNTWIAEANTGVNTGTIYVRYILPEEEPTPLTTRLLQL